MLVPALVYGDIETVRAMEGERSLEQAANVAMLPGIVGYSFCMPDVHQGYGFPIGGVAAFREQDGIISPGGVGYDISCGVRLMTSNLSATEIQSRIPLLISFLATNIPCGIGSHGALDLSRKDLLSVLQKGATWAVAKGFGEAADLKSIEANGCIEGANPDNLSQKALERGLGQLGTLGSGNHFLEIQMVDRIFDENLAGAFGLSEGQITFMIHCGSRGLGHQVCDDYLRIMLQAMTHYGIQVPDRQLCCAPIGSCEAKRYLSAMRAAANYALANREIIGHRVRESLQHFFPGSDIHLLYDVSHNMAHIERHTYLDKTFNLCVHRKGATRALPPGHIDLPLHLKNTGQPVLIPGSMGTASYVLVGTQRGAEECFASTCHGAGRLMSRTEARKTTSADQTVRQLKEKGIFVHAESLRTLEEETPVAYKNVDRIVDIVEKAGISRRVARLKPLGVIKG